jgi:hypothetical protein
MAHALVDSSVTDFLVRLFKRRAENVEHFLWIAQIEFWCDRLAIRSGALFPCRC